MEIEITTVASKALNITLYTYTYVKTNIVKLLEGGNRR